MNSYLEREQELFGSAVLGAVFSLGVIYLLNKYPGRPFDYVNDRYIDSVSHKKKNDDAPDAYNHQFDADFGENGIKNDEDSLNDVKKYVENIDEDNVVSRSRSIQKVLGISEEDVRDAVRKTKEDVRGGSLVESDGFTLSQLLDIIVIIGMIIACLYFVDMEAHGIHGDLSRVLQALFPQEFETLGISGRKK